MCTHGNGHKHEIMIKARDRVELIVQKGGRAQPEDQVMCRWFVYVTLVLGLENGWAPGM